MSTRREWLKQLLKQSAFAAGLSSYGYRSFRHGLSGKKELAASGKNAPFKIGVCDWSIGQRGKTEALALAKKIGVDGVQVSLGTSPENMHLLREEVQQQYLEAAREQGVAIGGLALGALNQVPYKSSRRAEAWVRQSVDVAEALGIGAVLLAFFGTGDIKNDPEGQQVVIRRLKEVAPKAEAAGVVLGIESWLSARDHLRILDAVGSENVQVYYDVANSHKMGYDIYEEIRQLGTERICEFHAKENGALLGKGRVDFQRMRAALDDIGYAGWIHIEGAVPPEGKMLESYMANAAFMHSLFHKAK